MGHHAVKKAVSLDTGEVSILINSHERTLAESAGRKLIRLGSKCSCIKRSCVSLEQKLQNIEDR